MADLIFSDVVIDPNPVKATGVYKISVGVSEPSKVLMTKDGKLLITKDGKAIKCK